MLKESRIFGKKYSDYIELKFKYKTPAQIQKGIKMREREREKYCKPPTSQELESQEFSQKSTIKKIQRFKQDKEKMLMSKKYYSAKMKKKRLCCTNPLYKKWLQPR